MDASAEISLYPLNNSEYESVILDFIAALKTTPGIVVETNGMSTQIFGNYETLMHVLTTQFKQVLEQDTAIIVMKMGKGILRKKA